MRVSNLFVFIVFLIGGPTVKRQNANDRMGKGTSMKIWTIKSKDWQPDLFLGGNRARCRR